MNLDKTFFKVKILYIWHIWCYKFVYNYCYLLSKFLNSHHNNENELSFYQYYRVTWCDGMFQISFHIIENIKGLFSYLIFYLVAINDTIFMNN
jgi:hypothetical protein